MSRIIWIALSVSAFATLAACSNETNPAPMETVPFGSTADMDRAVALWSLIEGDDFGYRSWGSFGDEGTIREGMSPHGAFVRILANEVMAASPQQARVGAVIVKENFGANDPQMLGAITVMQKIDGYDAENEDWFWVKYLPDGTPEPHMDSGRGIAGKFPGCIGCHNGARESGGDMIFEN